MLNLMAWLTSYFKDYDCRAINKGNILDRNICKGMSCVGSLVFSLGTSSTFSVMYSQKSKYPTEDSYAKSVQWTVYGQVKLSLLSPKQTNIPVRILHIPQNMFFQTS